jgi:hypothetical protein
MTSPRAAIVAALALSIGGCSTSPADLIDKPSPGNYVSLAAHNRFLDHPSPAVSGPAGFGLGLGTIIGIPVMVVALPVTLGLGIAAFTDNPKTSNLEILGNAIAWPDAVCAVGGCYAFGAIPNMIVGDSRTASHKAVATAPAPPPGPPQKDPGPPPGIEETYPPIGKGE